jgi:hypothetical protein
MQSQQAYVSRSRKAEERDFTQRALVQPPPHKERALWNFLTWSFFIAQVLAAEQFIGTQAKAGENLDLKAADPTTAMAMPPADTLAVADGTGNATEDVRSNAGNSLDDVFAPLLKLGNFDGSVIDLDSIAVARADDFAHSISVSGFGVAALPDPSSDISGGLTANPNLIDVVIPDIVDVIGDVTGPLLNTVEDIAAALTGIVDSLTDPLLGTVTGVVQALDDVVHDVLAPVTGLVADLTQPLSGVVQDVLDPVTDVVASLTQPLDDVLALPDRLLDGATSSVAVLLDISDDLAGTTQDVLASAGQLVLPVLNLAGLDDLFDSGRYTDYGIELQANVTLPGTTVVTGAIASVADAATEAADHIVAATRPLEDAGRHLAHVLDDVGSGGLVDRLL